MWNKLIEEAKKGNKEVMEQIINKLQPLIISSIKRYYNNIKEYEDLMQEGNLIILESIMDYDSTKGVHFLGYIKLNLKYLYLNKHKKRIHLSLNQPIGDGELEIIDLLISDDKHPLDKIIENEMSLQLKEALERLTERQREIVILYYIKNMSIENIGNKLGISYRTVVNTKVRALENLRKYNR